MTNKRLTLTNYRPNLKDARVRRRIADVLGWCAVHLSTTSPEPLHHDKLRAVFGSPGNPLTVYLRSNLLVQVGVYVVGKQPLSYRLNKRGFDKLRSMTADVGSPESFASHVYYPELSTLTFAYALKSNRYWHPLQNIKREHKAIFWAPYLPFNFDIKACAPTILFQCARKAGLPAILLDSLQSYLDDRSELRGHVAALTGMSLADSKQLINSLFNGARLQATYQCSAFRRLNYDHAAMNRLQTDRRVRSLRRDIKNVWSRLELIERDRQRPCFQEVVGGTAKPFEKKLKTGRQRWAYYFARERQILDAITDELRRGGIKHFTEHDGFRTEREIDVAQVEAVVLNETGFKIKLSEETCIKRASSQPAYGFYISADTCEDVVD